MRTKAVFFDLGGTLLIMRRDRVFRRVLLDESIELELDRVHSAYVRLDPWWVGEYGTRIMSPEETVRAYRALDAKVFLALFPESDPEDASRVAKVVQARWSEVEESIPLELYPDAEPLLKVLKSEGYLMALVSNAPPDTDRVIAPLHLGRYLDPIVISGLVGYSKPNPEIFRVALKSVGVKPSETVHIGDLYESDIVGARNAGIEGILLDRDGTQGNRDCKTLGNLSEVIPLLASGL